MTKGDGIGLYQFLAWQPGMRVASPLGDVLRLEGEFSFSADHEGGPVVEDAYQLRIEVPRNFPDTLPAVYEVGGRIPREPDHHVFSSGALCLGSPLRLHMLARESDDLSAFARAAVVPYLYATSHRQRHGGAYAFGELAHGGTGLLDDYAQILGLDTPEQTVEVLRLLGMKRRLANKKPCPCGCGVRLGKCRYNERVRGLRQRYGRTFFKDLYAPFRP